jgi:outer membrane protein
MRQGITIGMALLVMAAAIPARADVKLAYVDVQRALNECNAGKRAKVQFQQRIQVVEAKLQKEQNEVQALKSELEQKGMLMKPDQRQNLQDQYMTKLKDLDRKYKDSRDELQQKDNEVTGKIIHDLAQIIRTIGERDGYTMVMEKGSILWGTPGIDITDQVIRAYDATHAKIGSLGEAGGAGSAPTAHTASSARTQFGATAERRSTISK